MKRVFPLLFLTGCMLGPNYTPPEITVSKVWEDTGEVQAKWWEAFGDPLLTEYIAQAKECNHDILAAEANIFRARAIRQIVASNLFPHLGTDWNGQKTYFSKNGPVFSLPGNASGDTTALPFALQVPQVQNLFNALFDASWEIDLFGKTRRAVEAAEAFTESSIDKKNDLLLSIYAEVSRNYIELRSNQKKQIFIEKRVQLLSQQLQITQMQLAVGYANQLDVEKRAQRLDESKANLSDITAEIYKSIYTLSILTGKMPDELVDALQEVQPLPKIPRTIHTGLPSDLLKRRPDIRKAERELAAATATIGVAVASFFPTLNLMGMVGFQSLKLPELLQWGSRTFSYGTDISMPLYEGGKLIGQLRLTQAEEMATAHTYQQTVLNAFEEVQSALVAYQQSLESSSLQKQALMRAEISFGLTQQRYVYGLVDQPNLLEYQDQLIESQLFDLERETTALLKAVALYKSLGGGWDTISLKD